MYAVTVGTSVPPYVIGYEVMSPATFLSRYGRGNATTIYVTPRDLGGSAIKRFVDKFYAFYLENGKLVFDTNATTVDRGDRVGIYGVSTYGNCVYG